MSTVEIMAIWRWLALPGSTLAQDIVDAAEAAKDPGKSLRDCPWNYSSDQYFRKRRVAWRVAFRVQRERGEVPFIAFTARWAA